MDEVLALVKMELVPTRGHVQCDIIFVQPKQTPEDNICNIALTGIAQAQAHTERTSDMKRDALRQLETENEKQQRWFARETIFQLLSVSVHVFSVCLPS